MVERKDGMGMENGRLRGLVKTGMGCALHWTGSDRLIGALSGLRRTPLVLGYHRVVSDFGENRGHGIPGMTIQCRTFERQLDWIGKHLRLISLDELGSHLESGRPFDRPAAAITFDDGYGDFYYNAFPILKRKGIPAAVFVVTDLIGTSQLLNHDRLYLLLKQVFSTRQSLSRDLAGLLSVFQTQPSDRDRLNGATQNSYAALRALLKGFPQAGIRMVLEALEAEVELNEGALAPFLTMTWEMLSEMRGEGITIGSHTKSHVLLANESCPKQSDEIQGSRQELEKRLGTPIQHFAYPDGHFKPMTLRIVADCGYRFAYTSCQHRDARYPMLTIPRKLLWENSCLDAFGGFSAAVLSCQMNRVFDFMAGCGQDHRA